MLAGPQTPVTIPVILMDELGKSLPSQEPKGVSGQRFALETEGTWWGKLATGGVFSLLTWCTRPLTCGQAFVVCQKPEADPKAVMFLHPSKST